MARAEKLPLSMRLGIMDSLLEKGVNPSRQPQTMPIKEFKNYIYGKVCFRQENYIADLESKETFDVIMALSTVKWVHLNHGDPGLKAFFLKAFSQLSVGGLFILEAQDWHSYKKKKHLNEKLKENFKRILLRPPMFEKYLTEVIGFELVEKMGGSSTKGFEKR